MPFRLKVFYVVAMLISLGIAFTGTDSLFPPNRQLFYLFIGKAFTISAPAGAILMIGGIGLFLASLVGFFVDRYPPNDRK